MNYIITGLDSSNIRKQTEKGRIAAAKLYYEIRKDFSTNRWKIFNDPNDVLDVMNDLFESCIKNMQRKLDNTPIEVRCCDTEQLNTTGINVYLYWVRFTQDDRDKHAEKYHGDYLNDYVVLNITFEIIDTHNYR